MSDSTLCNYLNAAAAWLESQCPGLRIPLRTKAGGTTKADQYHPYLAEIISGRRIWKKPQDRKEPISAEMLDAMAWMAAQYRAFGTYRNHGRDPVLWDFACLACFTGSRLGEYGVSKRPKGGTTDSYPVLPNSRDVPAEWRGRPIAFIAEDFELFDGKLKRVDHATARRFPHTVVFVDVRFRYDKSKNNFTIKRFLRVTPPFCLVRGVLSILDRHYSDTARRDGEPLGFFIAENGRRYNIQGVHVKQFLAEACFLAHPDENHYLRLHSNKLVAHSFRVTAAVALHNAGVPIDVITVRLRWNSDAVKVYLRDSEFLARTLSFKAMHGAFAH